MKDIKKIHYGYVIVACCCLMMGINVGLTFSCAGIFYEPVSATLGVKVGVFGLYMSIMYITSSLMLPAAGVMMQKMSARWLLSGNSLLMGLMFIVMSISRNIYLFYIAGGVLGITLAFLLYLSFPTLVNRWFEKNVGLMIGICSAASGIGGMIFNPIAGKIISLYGWQWGYATFGIIIILLVTPLLGIFLRDYPQEMGLLPYGAAKEGTDGIQNVKMVNNATRGVSYNNAIKSMVFYGLIIFAFIMMGTSTLNLFIPSYVGSNNFSIDQASYVAAVVMGGVTIGKLCLGWINDRNCMVGAMLTTILGALGLVLLLMGSNSLWLIFAGAFLFGWEYAGVTVQTAMLTRKVFGNKDYSRIYAIISVALAMGGAVASGGWGLLADATSLSTIFGVGIVTLIVAAALSIWALNSSFSKVSNS